ncbi:Protein of unknown function [Lactobacillus helveticus CIRM-BIA 104]|uniref:Uncharacterized protein n=1 Tax=Lactobacillus helveticus CIRM-BIA 104 TaxID=1226333 RepID=U6FAF9_LACHE|nr:Protein of unknown function [Lactobacillus helveticus CIRM-BIA 104]CDI63118.1 Protein of unknown function [Lactobacillus helveticus CIRM-BIA 103]
MLRGKNHHMLADE